MARLTKAQKDEIKRGQGWICGASGCGKSIKSYSQIHHKNRDTNDNRKPNLVALCKGCHTRITKKQIRKDSQKGVIKFFDGTVYRPD